MPLEATHLLAGLDVPQPDRVIVAAGHQRASVRPVGQAPDAPRVSRKLPDFLAGGDIPQAHRAVLAA